MNGFNRNELEDLAGLFKVFGDPTRLKIMLVLSENEHSVNEIAEKLDMTQSAISHQLKNLKVSKLIKNRREGQAIYYSLDDDHVYNIIAQGLEHVEE